MSKCQCEQDCEIHIDSKCQNDSNINVNTDYGTIKMCSDCAKKMMQYQGLIFRTNTRLN